MDQENIPFSKNQGKSHPMTDLHILGYKTSFGYQDSYNYYDIDVNNILLLKKSDREYFVRYNDANKKKIVPLQLKIENCSFDELDLNNYTADAIVESNNKEFFIKCREIWSKIAELLDIENPENFAHDDDEGEYIEKSTCAIKDNIEMILHLFLHLLLVIHLMHHQLNIIQNKYLY